MKSRNILIAVVIPMLVIASVVYAGHQDAYDKTTDTKKILMDMGMESVKTKLKDPDSAKFRNMNAIWGQIPMVCGEVSSKNSSGDHSEYLRFFSMGGTPDGTILEEPGKATNFDLVWDLFKHCWGDQKRE